MVYVTSDLHFNHSGILSMERYQFLSIDKHNQFIVDRYNEVVGENDICYILGDIGFYSVYELAKWTKKLNGHKILIKGNHDRFTDEQAKTILGFEKVYPGPIYYNESGYRNRIILSHEPAKEAFENPYSINIHGHLHNSDLNLSNYFNVNVARTNYYPINIEKFIGMANKICKTRRENFGKEWYFSFYKFDLNK